MGFFKELSELLTRYATQGRPRYLMAAITGVLMGIFFILISSFLFWILPKIFGD